MVKVSSATKLVKKPLRVQTGDELFRNRDASLWKFWSHGVTSSFLSTWLECKEQARLHYVEGWNSRGNPLAIEFGSCMHWVFEHAYSEVGMKVVRAALGNGIQLKFIAEEWVKEYERQWLTWVEAPTQKQLEQQQHVYGLAQASLPHYFKRWDGDFREGKYYFGNQTVCPVEWISLEEIFEIPYEYQDGRKTFLRGRRDGLFRDKRGDLWVFDTKCRSVIKDDEILDTMPKDLQQMLYLWVTYSELGEWPKGTVLNIPRRPGQRFLKGETLQGLLGRVDNEVRNPKNYDHYFMRFQMAITPKEIVEWKRDTFDPIMEDVRGWWEGRHPHYATHQHATNKYGRAAMYTPIIKGEFWDCYRRDVPFPELREVA